MALLHREVEKNNKTPGVLVLMKVLDYHIFVLTCGQQELYKVFQREKKKEKKKSKEREPSAEKLQDRKSNGSTEQNKEVKKGNQMTALRFQTGGWHPTSLASLQGHVQGYRLKKANRHMT